VLKKQFTNLPMAIKQAAKRPALSFHSSFVNKYVAMAVRPLQMKMR